MKCQKCGAHPSFSEVWTLVYRMLLCKPCADAWWKDWFSKKEAPNG